ncbi:50S ribosomal protein L9 [Buchnera aphidicola]|uniref:50S ribosomal protein L9 n=1 Tax=Buchnera aphidicola TaxID=9 RepID=UPI0031B88D81
MKIILYKKVTKLGEKGNVVSVKPGYARNFLFPTGKAILASKENIEKFDKIKVLKKKKIANKILFFKNLQHKIKNLKKLKIFVKSSKKGKLFGSVNAKIISNNLNKIGIKIDKKNIYIRNKFIKKLGIYNIFFKLYKNINASMDIEILSK